VDQLTVLQDGGLGAGGHGALEVLAGLGRGLLLMPAKTVTSWSKRSP